MLARPAAGRVLGMDTGPMAETSTADRRPGGPSRDRALAASYLAPNSWEHAARRLELLEACYDEASCARASALGVDEGWPCLEAGAGHGSFARWLGARAGAAGRVVAAALDTRLLGDTAAGNIEVRQLDLTSGELPRGEFDFVHTRLVLMHIPARGQVLGRLCAALRPGGTLMVEEQEPDLAAGARPRGGGRRAGRGHRPWPGRSRQRASVVPRPGDGDRLGPPPAQLWPGPGDT
jgi:SAM-dependent methyltransferase